MTDSMDVDWTQIGENDRMRVEGGLSYPVTRYDNHGSPYVPVPRPATDNPEAVHYYTNSDGTPIEGEPPGGWAQVVADNRVIAGQAKSYAAALKLENAALRKQLAMMAEGTAAQPESDRRSDPLAESVERVVDGLVKGMTTKEQESQLWDGLQARKLGRITSGRAFP